MYISAMGLSFQCVTRPLPLSPASGTKVSIYLFFATSNDDTDALNLYPLPNASWLCGVFL
jgi:hypothetical protein